MGLQEDSKIFIDGKEVPADYFFERETTAATIAKKQRRGVSKKIKTNLIAIAFIVAILTCIIVGSVYWGVLGRALMPYKWYCVFVPYILAVAALVFFIIWGVRTAECPWWSFMFDIIVSIGLIVVIINAIIYACVWKEDNIDFYANGIFYSIKDDGTLQVERNRYTTYKMEKLEIPEQVHGRKVTSIGDSAFASSSVAEVILPNSITSIGNYAFESCRSLTNITIPDSVISINNSAFNYCYNLTNIAIGKGLTEIGTNAFKFCYKLVEIENNSNILLEEGSYANGSIAEYALNIYSSTEGNSNLSVTDDGYVFYCDEKNGALLLSYVGKGGALTLPANFNDKTYVIHRYAFYMLANITSVDIGDGVSEIGFYSFASCSNLTSISIGSGLESISWYAFYRTGGLDSIVVSEQNTAYHCSGNCLIETAKKVLILGCNNSVIPTDGSVTSIDMDAFRYCTMKELVLPDSVETIGSGAFWYCRNLEKITFGGGITRIEHMIFTGCQKIDTIYYNGTMDEWSQISKHDDWNYDNLIKTVICTDGQVDVSN